MQGNTRFLCWKCESFIAEFEGEHLCISYMATCPKCGAQNAVQFAFPLAKAVVIYPEERRPEGGEPT